MRIRILKDIPGYRAGETEDVPRNGQITKHGHNYVVSRIIKEGFAEEVMETVDIEAIRTKMQLWTKDDYGHVHFIKGINILEVDWFSAYRIVREVITRLNDGWEADCDNYRKKYIIAHDEDGFRGDWLYSRASQLPPIKDEETARKVIDLCTPELEILFDIKK